jgi:hypothetical protein
MLRAQNERIPPSSSTTVVSAPRMCARQRLTRHPHRPGNDHFAALTVVSGQSRNSASPDLTRQEAKSIAAQRPDGLKLNSR